MNDDGRMFSVTEVQIEGGRMLPNFTFEEPTQEQEQKVSSKVFSDDKEHHL